MKHPEHTLTFDVAVWWSHRKHALKMECRFRGNFTTNNWIWRKNRGWEGLYCMLEDDEFGCWCYFSALTAARSGNSRWKKRNRTSKICNWNGGNNYLGDWLPEVVFWSSVSDKKTKARISWKVAGGFVTIKMQGYSPNANSCRKSNLCRFGST